MFIKEDFICWALGPGEISVWVCLYKEDVRMRSKPEARLVLKALSTKQALHSSQEPLNTTEC